MNTSTPHAPALSHDGEMRCVPSKYLRGKSGLTRVELALLAYVLEHPIEQQGTRTEIAKDCDCAANSIPRAARVLRDLDLIEVIPVPGGASIYKIGRNMGVTGNVDVTTSCESRNTEVTTQNVVPFEPKQTTTGGVVTESAEVVTSAAEVVTSPPTPPLVKRLAPVLDTELNPETPEPSLQRGLGRDAGDFALSGETAPPQKPKRRRRVKRVATEESMPAQMTAKMRDYATMAGYLNGSGEALFRHWRDNHIAKATEIADHDASFRVWVGNAPRFGNPPPRKDIHYGNGIRPNPYIRQART